MRPLYDPHDYPQPQHLYEPPRRRKHRGFPALVVDAQAPALETHLTVKQVAERWGFAPSKVRELFAKEPGVVRLVGPKARNTRCYQSLRIPVSVMERVHRRLSLK
jgi:hypothetical protein